MKYKIVDKLSLLFDLYGSDADFIEEYENILAEKLLLSRCVDINEEVKNIELLKLRFGENKMIRSTVILRDVNDSQRFNTSYKEDLKVSRRYSDVSGLTPLNSTMLFVSSGYWPINSDVTHFQYPAAFKKVFDEIHEQFRNKKQIMLLQHHNNLGAVELELSFKNGQTHVFRCEPVQAIIVSMFDQSNNPNGGSISLETIADRLEAHPNYIRSKIFYWTKKAVIREVKRSVMASSSLNMSKTLGISQAFGRADTMVDDTVQYELVDNYLPVEDADDIGEEVENELISRDKLTTRDMAYNLKRYESKIISILSINGSKSLAKIKCLLDTVYKIDNEMINMSELSEILTAMVKKRKITVLNDIYSLCMHV